MPLVDQPFADTFDFARSRTAPYLDATGAAQVAAVDAPRLDHDEDGAPRGLLVEGRPQFSAADQARVVEGDWAIPGGTVLHEIETVAGVVERRAWYAPADPRGTVNACLNAKGRHRRIAYVPGYLPNRGGFVRWRNLFWNLGAIVLSEPGVAIAVDDNKLLLEG